MCSFIHKTANMTFDLRKQHCIWPLAKHTQEREHDVKVDDVAVLGVAGHHFCNISSNTMLSMNTSSGAC